MRPAVRSLLFSITALLLVALWSPRAAWAGKRSMIPPGHEQTIRELVERALEPSELGQPAIRIERDRVRVDLGLAEGPRFVLFHPEAERTGEIGEALATGVVIECGAPTQARVCTAEERARWRATAEALARERDPLASTIWTVEETGIESRPSAGEGEGPATRGRDQTIDRIAAWLALALALGLPSVALVRRERARSSPDGRELAVVLVLLGLFVVLTTRFTSLLPLHEHASFVARADCAIDQRCVDDPIGAWSPTSLHVLGMLLGALPYRVEVLSWVSLGASLLVMLLAWALVRELLIELERPRLARFGALTTLVLLATHPVHWRLAGSASFWPHVLACVLGAALSGLWASRQVERLPAAIGWLLAGVLLAFACGGNIVLLTLGPLGLLAPLCWTRLGLRPLGVLLRRAVIVGLPGAAAFALVVAGDLSYGLRRAAGEGGAQASDYELGRILHEFDALLLDGRVSAAIWMPLLLLAPAWLLDWTRRRAPDLPGEQPTQLPAVRLHPLRLMAPLIYAWVVPHAFLGVAAGELIGSGYPVGFLNHHWELIFSALAVGLGGAWVIAAITRRWPNQQRIVVALPLALGVLGLSLGPLAREGWRLASGTTVVERELAGLQASFAELPEHDLLVVPPRILPTLDDLPREGDPIEVNFPIGAYRYAMTERGLEPALVVALDHFLDPSRNFGSSQRILFYSGSSLHAFQPHEIRAGAVPNSLERPELTRLHDRWTLEKVREFELETEQHEAISLRLGADRMGKVALGFYWLHPRND